MKNVGSLGEMATEMKRDYFSSKSQLALTVRHVAAHEHMDNAVDELESRINACGEIFESLSAHRELDVRLLE